MPFAKRVPKRRLIGLLALLLLSTAGLYGAFHYARHRLLKEKPNTLVSQGELQPVPAVQDDVPNNQTTSKIPFRLTPWNNISIPAILNDSFAIRLMLHTAADEASLTESALEQLPEINLDAVADVESWGGSSQTSFGRGFSLTIGPLRLDDVTIFQSARSGHHTDGKLGPSQLKSPVIEIDFDRSEIKLHDRVPSKVTDWDRLDINIDNGMMFIEGRIPTGERAIRQQFLIHSGYSGFMLLDDTFVENHPTIKQLDVIEESKVTDSSGHEIKTLKSKLPRFAVGAQEFEDVHVSFFAGSLAGQKFSLVGGDFLKRFNLVFDLPQSTLYLRSNQHRYAEYF